MTGEECGSPFLWRRGVADFGPGSRDLGPTRKYSAYRGGFSASVLHEIRAAVGAVAAPANREDLTGGPDIATIGPGNQNVFRGTLGCLGGVAFKPQVQEFAVWHRFGTEAERCITAIDRG